MNIFPQVERAETKSNFETSHSIEVGALMNIIIYEYERHSILSTL